MFYAFGDINLAERIELWLHYSPKTAPTTPSSQSFEYLGFVALADNSATNFQSRELQSVSVQPKVGTHLKLRFGPPYKNDMNAGEQVSTLKSFNFIQFNSSNFLYSK